MIALADRRKPGPNGFLFHERRTNWKSWEADPVTQWDFNLLVTKYQEHAKSNPKFGLETDRARIEQMLDFANAMRYLSIPGADIYVSRTGASAPKFNPPHQPQGPVVAGVNNIIAGAKTLREWWGSGGKPVENQFAEQRASVCVSCPHNAKGGLLSFFTEPLARAIQKNLEEAHKLNLRTSQDDKLNVCNVCDCPLHLKIFSPIEHILNHMPERVRKGLPDHCWIVKESSAQSPS